MRGKERGRGGRSDGRPELKGGMDGRGKEWPWHRRKKVGAMEAYLEPKKSRMGCGIAGVGKTPGHTTLMVMFSFYKPLAIVPVLTDDRQI
jgi:hypothetical protein